jgi:hypothetical protein
MRFENSIGEVTISDCGHEVIIISGKLWGDKEFDNPAEALDYFKNVSIKMRLMEVMEGFVTEMEGYAYFGSNPGIPEDNLDEVANAIMSKFFVN